MKNVRFVGLDVHADTIAVAVAEAAGETRSVGVIPNQADAVRRLVKQLGPVERLQMCYEAGPTGYAVYWQLAALGVACEMVAPTLVPVKAGDRVKTDRRDAVKLARMYRAGELTAVWVPDRAHEALRDLVRAREAAKEDEHRARRRLSKLLLRQGRRPPVGVKTWGTKYQQWLHSVRLDHPTQEVVRLDYQHEVERAGERVARLERAIDEAIQNAPAGTRAVIAALQALRGVAQVCAATIVTEVGQLSRFTTPRQLMSYSGAVASEHSSGTRTRRGGITKTGNAHLRRVIIEAAWAYRYRPHVGPVLRKRQAGLPLEVTAIAWKAQHRWCRRYQRLSGRGKCRQQVVTAVGRELLGFIWAIGRHVETAQASR